MTDIGQPRSYDGHLIDGLVELTHRTERRQREQANAHEWLSEAGFVLSEDDWAAEHAQWVWVPTEDRGWRELRRQQRRRRVPWVETKWGGRVMAALVLAAFWAGVTYLLRNW